LTAFGAFDTAIVSALKKNPQGLRYNDLYRKSGEEYKDVQFKAVTWSSASSERQGGNGINVRTFDKHLKGLVADGILERVEEKRFRVFYKLLIPEDSFPKRYVKSIRNEFTPLFEKFFNSVGELFKSPELGKKSWKKYKERGGTRLRTKKEGDEFLVKVLIDFTTHWTRDSLVQAIKLCKENPAWSRYIIDEAAEISRNLCNKVVETLGKSEEAQKRVRAILDKLENEQRTRDKADDEFIVRRIDEMEREINRIEKREREIVVLSLKDSSMEPRWLDGHVEFFSQGKPISEIGTKHQKRKARVVREMLNLAELADQHTVKQLRKDLGYES
jgi:DNA-binding HxlR family transcriptional regulator